MELSGTAYVILGFLSRRPMSGYEIKGIVDRSVRFFWAASYGQLYPELHRLETAGLVSGEAAPTGGRQRTVYEITESGRQALRDWVARPGAGAVLRDQGLLKVFFADVLGEDGLRDRVRAMRAHHEETLAQLRQVEATLPDNVPEPGRAALDYGLGYHAWIVEWCTRTERRLGRRAATKART